MHNDVRHIAVQCLPALAKRGRIDSQAVWEPALAENVTLFIPGADSALSRQIVVLEASYDSQAFVAGRSPGADEASSLTALAATGERVLVLVADVARRRPLLSRHVLPPQLGRQGVYVQSACPGRLEQAIGAKQAAGPGHAAAGLDLYL